MAHYTNKGTVKNQMTSAGVPVMIKDIKKVELVYQSDWRGGMFHTFSKSVYLRNGAVYGLIGMTVDEHGFYSEASGKFEYSCSLVGWEGR